MIFGVLGLWLGWWLVGSRAQEVVFINAGEDSEDLSIVQGLTKAYFFNDTITDNTGEFDPIDFQDHRSADPKAVDADQAFNYSFTGYDPMQEANITLGFAENFLPNCKVGKRVFTVTVNGEPFAENLDVFSTAGCYSALVLTKTYMATTDGEFLIQFAPADGDSNPMIAILQVAVLESDALQPLLTSNPLPLATTMPVVQQSASPSSPPIVLAAVLPVSTSMPVATTTKDPTISPTSKPPTKSPVVDPTEIPSSVPSDLPSSTPNILPTPTPTAQASVSPTTTPTTTPVALTTEMPSSVPSDLPSATPNVVLPTPPPTAQASVSPTTTPTTTPVALTTEIPSDLPSSTPNVLPTSPPTAPTSVSPTTATPVALTTEMPSDLPSSTPSDLPTSPPVSLTTMPTAIPVASPSDLPSSTPNVVSTSHPTANPVPRMSDIPSDVPSDIPSDFPSDIPSDFPSDIPSDLLLSFPSNLPSLVPSDFPSSIPSHIPSSLVIAVSSPSPLMTPSSLPVSSSTNQESATNNTSQVPTASPTSTSPVAERASTPTEAPQAMPTEQTITDVFIVDATTKESVTDIKQGSAYDLSTMSDSLTLRVDVVGPVGRVRFQWVENGKLEKHTEWESPYLMGGKGSDMFVPIPYLTTEGIKMVSVDVFHLDNTLLERKVYFFDMTADGDVEEDSATISETVVKSLLDWFLDIILPAGKPNEQ